jgi:hypothetical protein
MPRLHSFSSFWARYRNCPVSSQTLTLQIAHPPVYYCNARMLTCAFWHMPSWIYLFMHLVYSMSVLYSYSFHSSNVSYNISMLLHWKNWCW